MVWQPEIDELKHRKELAARMGGPEGIERQRKRGKLTVRERIEAISDPGSFQEIGALAGSAKYKGEKLVSFTPANSVMGLCTINGRKVVLNGGDFTVRGGASDAAIAMELGVDGVLMNTAIAEAKDPLKMAQAMKLAVESGRLAFLAGRIPRKRYASASSPIEGLVGS